MNNEKEIKRLKEVIEEQRSLGHQKTAELLAKELERRLAAVNNTTTEGVNENNE